MSEQKQTPPTQPFKSHVVSGLDDGGPNAQSHQDDVVIFAVTTFKDAWDVFSSSDSQQLPEREVEESATTNPESFVNSERQVSHVRPYRWAPQVPIPGMMQTIGLVPLSEKGLVAQSVSPFPQGDPDRSLALPIFFCDHRAGNQGPCSFPSKLVCQQNPLVLPVVGVYEAEFPSEEEWKLRDVLEQRAEKLRILILLASSDVEPVLLSLGRIEDLLSEVTTLVYGDSFLSSNVYVFDLTGSNNRSATIADLVNIFRGRQGEKKEIFEGIVSARAAKDGSWRMVEATVDFCPSIHEFVSTYPKSPDIYLKSMSSKAMNKELKHELSSYSDVSEHVVDLAGFRNLRSLELASTFVNTSMKPAHDLRHLYWGPSKSTHFIECAWSSLSNLQCLEIQGDNLHRNSHMTLACFPKLVSLRLNNIKKGVVVDFGDIPFQLNDVKLSEFEGSLAQCDRVHIEHLCFRDSVCKEAYVNLCSKTEHFDVIVGDNDRVRNSLRLVADRVKHLKFGYLESSQVITKGRFPFSTLADVFPLLESLELFHCGVRLSAATFPRLHRLSQRRCDVSFPKSGVGQYGDSFPELYSWNMIDCKLLLDSPVPGDEVKDPVGTIRFQANSLLSLALSNVSNLKVLQIDDSVFPRLDCLQCHVANDDDFPFPEVEQGFSLFSHLRILSLKKKALDGKTINLSSLTEMMKLEKLELLENAFSTLGEEKNIQCRWARFSSSVVQHANGRTRLPAGMPVPAHSPEELLAIAKGLVNPHCDHLIIDRHVVHPSPRQAYLSEWYPFTFGVNMKAFERSKIRGRMLERYGLMKPRGKGKPAVPVEEKLPEEEDVPLDDHPVDQAGPYPGDGLPEEEDVPFSTGDGSFLEFGDMC